MNKKLLMNFYEIFKNDDNFISYKQYYKSLCDCLYKNIKEIREEILINNRLDILLSLDVDNYTTEEIKGNGLILNKEKERIGNLEYKKDEGLLLTISDTLWDLVTISSSHACKNCIYGDLRYVIADSDKTNKKVLLECKDCGCILELDGNKYTGKITRYIPAKKTDIL